MEHKYWLGAAAGALAIGLMGACAESAPASALGNDVATAAGNLSAVQTAHWDRPYYGYSYYPRRHYRHDYGYRYYRPYPYYYGYGPGFGFYGGPRYYYRSWW